MDISIIQYKSNKSVKIIILLVYSYVHIYMPASEWGKTIKRHYSVQPEASEIKRL